MKNNLFNTKLSLVWLVLLAFVVSFSACGEDEDEVTPVILEDGFYVKGAETSYAEFDIKGKMSIAKNEVGQAERATMYEAFIAVKAGATGFSIANVAGANTTVYGPGTDYAVVETPTGDEPQVANATFSRGAYVESATPFTVAEDGLYHVVLDTELGIVTVIQVKYWGVIGAATPGGWSNDTKLESKGFDLASMSFEATNIKLMKGEMKFRYSGAWKVELFVDDANADNSVKVNTNFGSAIDALVAGGDNIAFADRAFYTITMVWTAGEGFAADLLKTDDVVAVDYTDYEMGMIGNAFYLADGTTQDENWSTPVGLSKPSIKEHVYTWTYTGITMIADGAFKFRQGNDWDGKSIGYDDCTWAGASASNLSSDGGNIKVTAGGVYNVVLSIDADTEIYTVTVTQ